MNTFDYLSDTRHGFTADIRSSAFRLCLLLLLMLGGVSAANATCEGTRTVSNTDNCLTTGANADNPGYVFYLHSDNGSAYFSNESLTWTENGDGTATLSGVISNNANGQLCNLTVHFENATTSPPSGSPKEHLCNDEPGNGYLYYTSFNGALVESNTGYTITFFEEGPSFQVGFGANITEETLGQFGASGWFQTDDNNFAVGDINLILGPLQTNANDSDNDGICDDQDCAPNNPNVPAVPGTPCNDGDPNTDNDVVTADGCDCAGDQFTGEDCCDDFDKPSLLTFTYVGGSCPGNNTQDDKSDCDGTTVNAGTVQIEANEKDDGSGDVFFSGTVALGENFTLLPANGDDDFPSVIYISVNGEQLNEIHTSCSAPIVPGETFGALRLDGLVDKDGFTCGNPDQPDGPDGPVGGNDCGPSQDACDEGDKPNQLAFRYVGGACPGNNTQGDKSDCNGDAVNAGTVTIEVNEKEDGSGDTYYSATVALGEAFVIDPVDGDDDFPSRIYLLVDGQLNEFHTSCSAPIIPGETFGALQLIAVQFKNGFLCGVTDPCDNAGGDTDDDGVCDDDDCAPNNPNFPAAPGTVCNDGNPNTTGDIVTDDGCGCEGTPVDPCDNAGGDSDDDGICDDDDCAPNNPNFPAAPGTACNDGNPNTTGDIVTDDGCDCEGTPVGPCDNAGGDSDNDGICDDDDCAPNNPNFPAAPGTACNDGDASTTNDQVTADGCGCEGTPTNGGGDPDCDDIVITTENGKIIITGLDNAPVSSVQIFTADWNDVYTCFADCDAMTMVAVPGGDYLVYVKYYTGNYSFICGIEDTVTVPGGNGGGGDPCDNAGGDSDNDGVCDNDDCAPNNPNFPATPGTACNDGDANTTNDQVTADGCGCEGTPGGGGGGGEPDCADINISTDNGKIIVTGLDGAPVSSLQVFDAGWNDIFSCFADCGAMQMLDVPAGDYIVYAKYFTSSYQQICVIDEVVTVGGGGGGNPCDNAGGDSDNDGVCDNDDCAPNNPNFPATPGTPCNDGNANTTNDQVTADGCGCEGTPGGGGGNPCDSAGGDSDNDGVCDNDDCAPNNPNFPAAPGTPCNDGDANTTNDQVTADGCGCEGTPNNGGGDPDCADISITTNNGAIVVSGLDGAPVTSLQIFDSNWQTVFQCFADCPATKSMAVPEGTYQVYVKYYTAGYAPICVVEETVTVGGGNGGGGGGGGQTCPLDIDVSVSNVVCNDNGTPNNANDDTFTFDLLATGGNPWGYKINNQLGNFGQSLTVGPFSISSGSVDLTLIDNDNPTCTANVSVDAPSSCSNGGGGGGGGGGGEPNCDDISVTTDNGKIIVTGLENAPVTSVQVFNSGWGQEFQCFADCGGAMEMIAVPAGTYYVYVKFYTADYQLICGMDKTVTVGGGGGGGNTPTVSVGDQTVNEADGTATVQVCLSEAATGLITVDFATNNGSATAPTDYQAQAGTVTFQAGQTCRNLVFTIVDDQQEENDETFNVVLSNPNGATIDDGTGTVTILDNDEPVIFPNAFINDVVVNEEDGTATLTISLSQPSNQSIKINYFTINGTAQAPGDFIDTDDMVTFAPGETTKTITIPIVNDNVEEPTEEFIVRLIIDSNQPVVLADEEGTVTIFDNDDPAPVVPAVSISDVTVNENAGTASLEISLSEPTTVPVKVTYSTSNGTATAGQDYTAENDAMVTIQPGQVLVSVDFVILDDNVNEPNEQFNVTVTDVNNGTIADGAGKVTIIDNDDPVDPCAGDNSPQVTVFMDNPDCGENNGKIIFQFPDNPNRTNIEFSRDGGQTYPLNVSDAAGSASFMNLGAGSYDIAVRWGNNDCPVDLGTKVLIDGSQAPGTACNDGNAETENDVILDNGCDCAGTPVGPDVCEERVVDETQTGCGTDEEYAFFAADLFSGISEGTRYKETDMFFKEFTDGTARLTGKFVNNHNPNIVFYADVTFTGRTATPPVGSPKSNGCVNVPNNNDFYYYPQFSGTLTGQNAVAGLKLNVTRKGESFQVGTGANLQDADQYGASGWVKYTVASQPNNNAITIKLDTGMDFNFRLSGGQPDCPVDGGGVNDPCDAQILFVVGSTTLSASDAAVKARLVNKFGAGNIMVKADDAVSGSDANGKDLVVISASVLSSHIGTKFTHKAVPVVTWESWLFDDLKLTGPDADWEYGSASNTSKIVITNGGHPLAAGIGNGNKEVFGSNTHVRWGKPNSNAIKVGHLYGASSKQLVFGYEQGASLIGGTSAPARRVGLFFDANFHHATTNGKKLFDAAIHWAIHCTPTQNFSVPTDVLNFDANASSDQTVDLTWASSLGYVTETYVVEHSTDREHWTVIGEQSNPTDDNRLSFFEETDHEPQIGENYYRVGAQLLNGSFHYSTVDVVVLNDLTDFGVFPNPADTELSVNLKEVSGARVTIQLFDQMGRQLNTVVVDEATATPHRLDLQHLIDGQYLLLIQPEGRRPVTKRFVVAHH